MTDDVIVFDIETDGIRATKLHVFSYTNDGQSFYSVSPKKYTPFTMKPGVYVGHNIRRYDIPTLERLYDFNWGWEWVDTLVLSWYLFPERQEHGLDSWGVDFGVPKPKITDWESLTYEEYRHRCEEDVKINWKLLDLCKNRLALLYECDPEEALQLPIVRYLMFKIDCAAEQERSRWKIDKQKCESGIELLTGEVEKRTEALKVVMPKIAKMVKKARPAKPFKKDGSWSSHGEAWFALLDLHNLPHDYAGTVEVLHHYEEPNPASHPQVKDWLYSLGWEPETFKYERTDDGDMRTIPQVRKEGEEGKELCPSVKRLIKDNPQVAELEGLTVAQHRLSTLTGFLRDADEEGYIQAQVSGLTNTLRFKHKTVVNLPGVKKPYGELIRGCLVASEGKILCGSDMSSLEDLTKRHYMYEYDPEYVKEMSVEGFDPHLNLALFAKALSEEEVETWKWAKKAKEAIEDAVQKVVHKVTIYRKKFKVTNYSATYGVGAPKLAREMQVPVNEAKSLLEAYWKRNWSIRAIADSCRVKRLKGQDWLFNPVSQFWYPLRAEKDRFSTLNQGTGVFCFDTWLEEIRKVRPQLTAQFHDECVLEIKIGAEAKCEKLLRDAMKRVNDKLKLNVKLDCEVQFGHSYGDVH